MRKLMLWMLLSFAGLGPAFAQADNDATSSSTQPVFYYIPDIGVSKFNPGTTREQADAIVCSAPGTSEKYKRDHCPSPTPDAGNAQTATPPDQTTPLLPQPKQWEEVSSNAWGATALGGIIALALTSGTFFLLRGSSEASAARKRAAYGASVGVFIATTPLVSDMILWGSAQDKAINHAVGSLLLSPLLAGLGYYYVKRTG